MYLHPAALLIAAVAAQTLLLQPTRAQSAPLLVTGRITDAKSGEPVPYAHVGVAERNIWTASGFDGGFELKLPRGLENVDLTVSSIGYATYREPLPGNLAGLEITLAPSVASLVEVVVMDEEAALNIVRRAVAAIPDNYPTAPTNSLAFYRESLTDDSLRYRYLAEGVLEVHKTSYKNRSEGQVGRVQARKINLRDPLDTVVVSGFSSGHMAAHRFDFVKQREDFINEDFFPVYRYRLDGMTTYNGKPVYIIAFEPNAGAEAPKPSAAKRIGGVVKVLTGQFGKVRAEKVEARLAGRVFITKDEHAFLRAEFAITPEGLRRTFDYPLYSGGWKGNTYTVNYRESGGRWTFSDALREGRRRGGAVYVNEVKTTELLDGVGEAIPYLERLQRDDEFVDVTGGFEPDFWRDYNVVPMREDLAEGMRQYELMAKASEVFGATYQDSLQQLRDSLAAPVSVASTTSSGIQLPTAGDDPIDPVERADEDRGRGLRFTFGPGVHLLPSGPLPLAIGYGPNGDEPALELAGTLGEQELEAIVAWSLDYRFHPNFFARYTTGFDLSDNVYKHRAIGLGAEANLRPRARPVIVRGIAQYSNLRYYRTLGRASHGGNRLDIGRKTFKTEDIRLGYGAHRHDLALTAELSVETRRSREVYVRATLHHNLARRPGVWFKETGQIFRKDHRLPVDDERVTVRSDDAAFAGALVPQRGWSATLGWVFK